MKSIAFYVKEVDDGAYWIVGGLLGVGKETYKTAENYTKMQEVILHLMDEALLGAKSTALEDAEKLVKEVEEEHGKDKVV